MAKRFTDTDKWKKPFIRAMKAPYKLLWLYIIDECNHAGIWEVDFDVAEIKIGEKLNKETALAQLSGKVFSFDGGEKWFIPDFIEFQYGTLNPENRVHKSVLDLLTKYSLLDIRTDENKPLASPLEGVKDKDKDKDKSKDKEKDKESAKIILPFDSEDFKTAWNGWKQYKKEQHKFTYKGQHSEQIALKSLGEKSGNNEQTAIKIIQESIANGWNGLFELKTNNNGKQTANHKLRNPDGSVNWGEVDKSANEFLAKSGLG